MIMCIFIRGRMMMRVCVDKMHKKFYYILRNDNNVFSRLE